MHILSSLDRYYLNISRFFLKEGSEKEDEDLYELELLGFSKRN